ncbi:MAG: ankyrin repeat domain-containing protein [Wolbachia endosymbiont of Tyrophagus putrescentiae]|nr:ankyrin repeat domain-containing protein [Wolbachia endosymbiont of Tyrophagus putrescentiae]
MSEVNFLNTILPNNTQQKKNSTITNNQVELNRELLKLLEGVKPSVMNCRFESEHEVNREGIKELKEFLDKHKDNEDLKIILNLRDKEFKSTILHNAEEMYIDAIGLLIDAGADPNIQDKDGLTPVHYCASNPGSYEVLKVFLEKNARVDIQDDQGNTPLHYAAHYGYKGQIELLINETKQKMLNMQNSDGETALNLAFLQDKDQEVAELILEAKDIDVNVPNNLGQTSLLLSAWLSNTEILKLVIKKGANIKRKDKEGNSALHYAVCNTCCGENLSTRKYDMRYPDYDLFSNNADYSEDTTIKNVNALIAAGISINVKNENNNTPLFFAVQDNRYELVKTLLEKGAKVDIVDKNGFTIFHYALKNKNLEMLKLLFSQKVKIDEDGVTAKKIDYDQAKELCKNIRDNEGNTLLHQAVKWGCGEEVLSFLVEHGIDINAKNKNGVAPIHIAAKYGDVSTIDFFIQNRADLNMQCDRFTKSEIEVAETNVITIDNGNKNASSVINVKNNDENKGASPMLIAADNNHSDAVITLLSVGVKPDIADRKGWTPLQIAIKRACSAECTKEEQQKSEKIIETLAMFSPIPEKSTLCIANNNEKVAEIMKSVMISRNAKPLLTSLITDEESSTTNISVHGELGSYINELPVLQLPTLYSDPDLSKTVSTEPSEFNMGTWDSPIPWPKKWDDIKIEEWSPTTQEEIKSQKSSKVEKLTSGEQPVPNIFIKRISETQSMKALEKVVYQALNAGVRINYNQNKEYCFTSYVIDRIQQFDGLRRENCEITSRILCQLISRGVTVDAEIDKELNAVYSDHSKNKQSAEAEFSQRKKALQESANDAACQGKLEQLDIDNTTFFLEYSKDSVIDVAKIIDRSKDLGLHQGEIECGTNIIKIGKSEVEFNVINGMRNYTDLSDDSDIMLTFPTSAGKVEVRLYPDSQDTTKIKVEVTGNKEILQELKNKNEKIGSNCLLGKLKIAEAIEQGFFTRSGNLANGLIEVTSVKKPSTALNSLESLVMGWGESRSQGRSLG